MIYHRLHPSTQLLFATGEAWQAIPSFVATAATFGTLPLASLILFCSIMGILLNFALFWSTQLNSALTTTIIGVMKGVVTTILGFVLLGGVRFDPLNFSGIMINMAGGVGYSVAKYRQRQARLVRLKHDDEAPPEAQPLQRSTK